MRGNFKGRLFDCFGKHRKILSADGIHRAFYNARSAYAYIDHAFRLSDAVECAGHKRVILRRIGKHHETRAVRASGRGGKLRRLFYQNTKVAYRVPC